MNEWMKSFFPLHRNFLNILLLAFDVFESGKASLDDLTQLSKKRVPSLNKVN